MSATIWQTSKMRLGRVLKNKKREAVDVLVCNAVPWLVVRTGMMVDTRYEGPSLPMYPGAQIISANNGHTVGPSFYGDDAACEAAAAIAGLFDWAGYDGSQKPTTEQSAAIFEALEPIMKRNGEAYQAFLAEHRRKDEEQHKANMEAMQERPPRSAAA